MSGRIAILFLSIIFLFGRPDDLLSQESIDCRGIPLYECLYDELAWTLQGALDDSKCHDQSDGVMKLDLELLVDSAGIIEVENFDLHPRKSCRKELKKAVRFYAYNYKVDSRRLEIEYGYHPEFTFTIEEGVLKNNPNLGKSDLPLFGPCVTRECSDRHIIRYMQQNVKYPAEDRENRVEGRVFTSIVIGVDGELSDIKIVRSLSAGTDAEILRILREMPSWKPAIKDDKPISFKYFLVATYKLDL